jgi:hypothetical protein
MHGLTPILAEVADKEPSLGLMWSWAVVLAVVCFIFSRWRPWGLLIGGALSLIWADMTFSWFREPGVESDIVGLLGQDYVTSRYISALFPIMIFGLALLTKKRRNHVA